VENKGGECSKRSGGQKKHKGGEGVIHESQGRGERGRGRKGGVREGEKGREKDR
jgi:hypothetical protein